MPWLFFAFLTKFPIQLLLTDMFSFAMQFLEGWIVFAEYARPRINAIASQTHTEPSNSKPDEKRTTPEKNGEMKKETAGEKKNKKKKITAKVVADQPMDKDKDKK